MCRAASRRSAPTGDVLVCGLARYHRDGRHAVDERPTDLLSARAGARVLAYFARVNVNGALFGLARRADLLAIGFADSWAATGGSSPGSPPAAGCARCATSTSTARSRGSPGAERLARSFGMRGAARATTTSCSPGGWPARSPPAGRHTAALTLPERALVAPAVALLVLLRFPGWRSPAACSPGSGSSTSSPASRRGCGDGTDAVSP